MGVPNILTNPPSLKIPPSVKELLRRVLSSLELEGRHPKYLCVISRGIFNKFTVFLKKAFSSLHQVMYFLWRGC